MGAHIMTHNDTPIQLLTVRDVASRLAIKPRTVWRLAAAGKLPSPVKLGTRTTRWVEADIKRYLDSLTSQA